MCISRLCQYFFLSSFLCSPYCSLTLLFSFFQLQLRLYCLPSLSLFVPLKCSPLVHRSIVCLCSWFLCEVGADRGVRFGSSSRLWALASEPNTPVAQWLEVLAGLYPPMILHYETMQAGRRALQLNWHHWKSANTNILIDVHITRAVSPPQNRPRGVCIYHTYRSCYSVSLHECMCFCTSPCLCTPQVSLCPATGAPGGLLIYSCGPREDRTSSSSFGLVWFPEHILVETQVHGGVIHCPGLHLVDSDKLSCSTCHAYWFNKYVKTAKSKQNCEVAHHFLPFI